MCLALIQEPCVVLCDLQDLFEVRRHLDPFRLTGGRFELLFVLFLGVEFFTLLAELFFAQRNRFGVLELDIFGNLSLTYEDVDNIHKSHKNLYLNRLTNRPTSSIPQT